MTYHMRDMADKRRYRSPILGRWRRELFRDPDRLVFWFLLTMVVIAAANGWLR